MSFDTAVYERCCVGKEMMGGHNIVSIITGEDVDLVTKQIVHRYETICNRCGMTLTEMQTPPPIPKKTRAKRKPQLPEQEPVDETST